MKDSDDFKWEWREREKNELEERWKKEDQWNYEAKKELENQKWLDEKKWDQDDQFYTNLHKDTGYQTYLDNLEFDHYMKKLDYRKREMRALEEKWREEDEWELEEKRKSDSQWFLEDKNFKKW
jgi:hypothetical protein